MSDFSDLILLVGAMVAFSLLSSATARTFQASTDTMIRAELEYRAIARAQDIIDEARWITNENELSSNSNSNSLFYGFPKTETISYGESNQYKSEITLKGASTLITSTPSINQYLITVILEDDFLDPPISDTLRFVKSFDQ